MLTSPVLSAGTVYEVEMKSTKDYNVFRASQTHGCPKKIKSKGISENLNTRQYEGSPYSQHFLVLSCLFWSATNSPVSFLWDAHADITFLYLDTIVFLINRFPIYTFGTFAFLSDRNLTDIGKNTVNAITMWLNSF